MLSHPLVSIIVPTYNSEKTIDSCILSIFEQSFTSWELHVVDNSSSDSTVSLLRKYQHDPRFHLHTIDNGGSIAKSRNLAIKRSSGTWIAFLDSDDIWHPSKLSTCMTVSDRSDLIYHSVSYIYDDPRFTPASTQYSIDHDPLKSLLLKGNPIVTSTVLLRASFIPLVGYFDTRSALVTAEDYALWLAVAKAKARFKFIDSNLASYRISSVSASRRRVSIPISLAQKPYLKELPSELVPYARSLPAYFLFRHHKPSTNRRFFFLFYFLLRYSSFNIRIRVLILSLLYFFK